MIRSITDATFEDETNVGLVLIDFWAEWCAPCRLQSPVLEQLTNEFDANKFKILKMNTEQNKQTTNSFMIMSIPTLLIKKDGEIVERLIGLHYKEQLIKIVNRYIGNKNYN